MLAMNAAAFSYSAVVIPLLARISTRSPTAGLNRRRALDDRFSTSFPAWMTARAIGWRIEIARRGSLTGRRPAQSARRLAIDRVTSRNHAVWFTAYCQSLSDLSLSRVRAPRQKLGTI